MSLYQPDVRELARWSRFALLLFVLLPVCSGCWAPLRSPGIPAYHLPDCYRTPTRGVGSPLNFANLTARRTGDYILGPNDVLEIIVPGLFAGSEIRPLSAQVMDSNEIQLPLVGPVRVGGMNLLQAQAAITMAYADGVFKEPRVSVALAAKSTVDILVLGEVNEPGIQALPRDQNDVGHALASAGGLSQLAADSIEVHRRWAGDSVESRLDRPELEEYDENPVDPKKILRIPLRGLPSGQLEEKDVVLWPGDVVVVPSRRNEVFWVVGELSQTNLVRFTLGDRERELGTGLVLPPDRDIDVVTAVVMAGYIDPIDSPTTVTVQRTMPDGEPMLIRVDLLAARYDRRETILVEPGDIIYLNPDARWWLRRTFDRVVPDLITIPYANLIFKSIFGDQ